MSVDLYSVDPLELRRKVEDAFGELSIDKRRLPASKLTTKGIPGYVAEWVLGSIVPGEGPLTEEESRKLNEWTRRNCPAAEDAGLVRQRLAAKGSVKVLTFVEADVVVHKDKEPEPRAKLPLLGIKGAQVPPSILEQNPELVRQGMWGIATIETSDGAYLSSFKPMQASVDLELFRQKRSLFSTEEWIALLLHTVGLNPLSLAADQALYVLARLLPLAQKSMHLLELAPKGTGKSYLYENLSPKVRLVSSGTVSPAVLFVNNATLEWGLLARFKVVVLDEVQTMKLTAGSEVVGALKGFLANGKLTKGGKQETSSDCSLVLLANIELDEKQRPMGDSLVERMPPEFQETALLDRFRGIIPGWKIPKLTSQSFSEGRGLKADFFSEALCGLREELVYDHMAERMIRLTGNSIYQRNSIAVWGIAAGLMKILFPHRECTKEEFERFCLRPAIEMRQYVWRELWSRDAEYRRFDDEIQAEVV